MNATDHNEEELKPVIEGPGKRLRDIRIEKNIDITRVATLLHLNVALLESLEADDYSQLHGTVFVQGYLRNYARLLDIPVEPILDAFQQFRPAGEEKMDLKVAKIKHEVRSSHTLIRLITWIIVIGLVALVVTWWRGYLQWPINIGLKKSETAIEQSVTDSNKTAVASPDATPQGMEGSVSLSAPLIDKPEILDAPVSESPTTESESAAVTAEPDSAADSGQQPETSEKPAATATSDTATASSPEAVADAGGVATPEKAPAEAAKQVKIMFSGASWADIKDASGSYRLIGNKGAGEHYLLGGEAPYSIVLGNASAVSILVNGQVYDLTPYIRGNVARLTLNPE